jgi:hypothetical protein
MFRICALMSLCRVLCAKASSCAFKWIRGCVYVRENYGPQVPQHPSGELRRVDQGSDPMDAKLVGLVERVSNRLDALR